MVLELTAPHGATLEDLVPLLPIFLSYVLSFANLAIYWNNHHHLLQAAKTVNGRVLWANMKWAAACINQDGEGRSDSLWPRRPGNDHLVIIRRLTERRDPSDRHGIPCDQPPPGDPSPTHDTRRTA